MGKQRKTIRNKRKIKVENYENNYIDSSNVEKKVTKAFTREAQFTIISIFLVTIILISSAYAIFSSVQKQENYNTLTVGTLKIDFDQSSTDMGNIINLNGAYPTSDENGQNSSPYSFKITNSGTLAAYYKIKIVDDTDMITEDGCQNNLLPKDKIKVSINGETPFLLSSTEANSYIVNDGTLAASKSKTFEIRIWIDEAAGNEVLGKHYHGKIVVEGENTTSNTNNIDSNTLCKRATVLHTEECNVPSDQMGKCGYDGYTLDGEKGTTTITYGNLGTIGILTSGDAFDCDVNGDGIYDSTTERFYYVKDLDNDTAVLFYYNNVVNGIASTEPIYIFYGENNYNGPTGILQYLPTTTQWKNISLKNPIRAIVSEKGESFINIRTDVHNLPTNFSYEGYAARLLTYQEIETACSLTDDTIQKLNGCTYLLENIDYSGNLNSGYATNGYRLENPSSYSYNNYGVMTILSDRTVYSTGIYPYGVRPVIEVAKDRIAY